VVHPDNGVLLSTEKKKSDQAMKAMEEPYVHVASERLQLEGAADCSVPEETFLGSGPILQR
jgi:hypothetical protein